MIPAATREPPAGALEPADSEPCAEGRLRVAPHAVVRAARWPISCLATLSKSSGAASPAGAGTPQHEWRLLAEVRCLWHLTLGDAAFRRALAASHPLLFRRLRAQPAPQKWSKGARHLAVTLYQQLGRACWRTEPNALWAGVGLTLLSRHQSTGPAAAADRVVVEPNLQPYAEILAALARLPAYRWIGLFAVHARARRRAAGQWSLQSQGDDQAWHELHVDLSEFGAATADRCIEQLIDLGPAPHDDLLRVASDCLGRDAGPEAFLDRLASQGLVTGGLALPNAFETAWEALERAATFLHERDRAAWRRTAASLRRLCDRLQQHHATTEAEEICSADEHAGHLALDLAQQCGVAATIAAPRAYLCWSSGLPAPVTLDARTSERIARALTAHERHRLEQDPIPALDALHARALDRGEAAPFRDAIRHCVDKPTLTRRLQELRCPASLIERLCADSGASRSEILHSSPFGLLTMRVGRNRLLLTGSGSEPWLSYGRFGTLLGATAPHDHPLHHWCDAALREFAQETGTEIVQVRASCAPLANLLAQPRFGSSRQVDLDGTTPGALPVNRLVACSDGQRRWLQSSASASPLLAIGATALDLGARDQLLERLMLTGWRYRPPVPATPLRQDPAVGVPRLLVQDVLRSRARWRLSGARAEALAGAQPHARWNQWRDLAREWNLPPLLTVSRAGAPALPMPRDSALAVETMFRRRADDPAWFDIEAVEDECLLTTGNGERHATELIVLFAREQHDWSRHDVELDPVPARDGAADGARTATVGRAAGC